MPRTLYSPRLSDNVIRKLYREGQRRKMPMTRLADELITTALSKVQSTPDQQTNVPEPRVSSKNMAA